MVELADRPVLGPYVLTKTLQPSALGTRTLALHTRHQSSHVVHRLHACTGKAEQRRFLRAMEQGSQVENPHLLRVERFAFELNGSPWFVTPYTGNVDGILTLERLLRIKGGQMSPDEAERALSQLFDALVYAHARGIHHGPVTMTDVLVDRHGSLLIELFGMQRCLEGLGPADAELIRDEVRSVVELGYQMITGLVSEEPFISAGRLVRRLPAFWDEFLDRGLDPSAGYDTAAQARAALQRAPVEADSARPTVNVKGVLGRFRAAMNERA